MPGAVASAGPPPQSADGLWFWDGSRWRSLVSADGKTSWNGKAWVPLPPFLIGKTLQPPSAPPPGADAAAPLAPPASPPADSAPAAPQPGPPVGSPSRLPSPPPSPPAPGYAPPPPPPANAGPPGSLPSPPAGSPAPEVEPRPSWLPADAPWPPATFTASPDVPLTTDAPMAAPAAGAVPWANVYSDVIASSTSTHGYSYAGFWIRFIAYLVDSLILGVPVSVFFLFIFGGSAAIASQDQAQIRALGEGFQLLYLAATFIYFLFFWTQGSTPGMRLVNIRVADQTTFQSIGPGKAVLRFIGYVVSSFCCSIGFIWAAFDGSKQGWHDKIAGTIVVYR